MKFWKDPNVVNKTPLVTVFLLEAANVGQLVRMWNEKTAAGQSLWAWISVWLALILWSNFYRICTPKERFALWATLFGLLMNSCVIATVIYWRYIV